LGAHFGHARSTLARAFSIARSAASAAGRPSRRSVRVVTEQRLDAVAELVGDLHQRPALVDQQRGKAMAQVIMPAATRPIASVAGGSCACANCGSRVEPRPAVGPSGTAGRSRRSELGIRRGRGEGPSSLIVRIDRAGLLAGDDWPRTSSARSAACSSARGATRARAPPRDARLSRQAARRASRRVARSRRSLDSWRRSRSIVLGASGWIARCRGADRLLGGRGRFGAAGSRRRPGRGIPWSMLIAFADRRGTDAVVRELGRELFERQRRDLAQLEMSSQGLRCTFQMLL